MRIVILAKAPVAGHVKTRLIPRYTATEAAELHARMAAMVIDKACSVSDKVWLAADNETDPFFTELAAIHNISVCSQGSGTLGKRLTTLMTKFFAESDECVLFLGSDSPHVPAARYREALGFLAASDVVIGPVEDGGYDLILIKQPYKELFKDIAWGSEHVYRQTIDACRRMQLKTHALRVSFDLDRAEDLDRAPPDSW